MGAWQLAAGPGAVMLRYSGFRLASARLAVNGEVDGALRSLYSIGHQGPGGVAIGERRGRERGEETRYWICLYTRSSILYRSVKSICPPISEETVKYTEASVACIKCFKGQVPGNRLTPQNIAILERDSWYRCFVDMSQYSRHDIHVLESIIDLL